MNKQDIFVTPCAEIKSNDEHLLYIFSAGSKVGEGDWLEYFLSAVSIITGNIHMDGPYSDFLWSMLYAITCKGHVNHVFCMKRLDEWNMASLQQDSFEYQ